MGATVNLAPGEKDLFESIIEHVYPDPKTGSTLPVEQDERRAARGLAEKGLVILSVEGGVEHMTFTQLGAAVYERQRCAGR